MFKHTYRWNFFHPAFNQNLSTFIIIWPKIFNYVLYSKLWSAINAANCSWLQASSKLKLKSLWKSRFDFFHQVLSQQLLGSEKKIQKKTMADLPCTGFLFCQKVPKTSIVHNFLAVFEFVLCQHQKLDSIHEVLCQWGFSRFFLLRKSWLCILALEKRSAWSVSINE